MFIGFGNQRRSRGHLVLGGSDRTVLGLLVGITPGQTTPAQERHKVTTALGYGVQTVTDLTTNGDVTLLHQLLELDVTVGTVPIYAAVVNSTSTRSLSARLLKHIEYCVRMGVDFFSIHASLSTGLVHSLSKTNRAIPITSRGGVLVSETMRRDCCENPFVTIFDELVQLCAENSVALSFVASLRPGSIVDCGSAEYLTELQLIAYLAERATRAGVTTMVELLNHLPLQAIPSHIAYGRKLFPHSALGALGPTPTDIAVGLDDVAGAIGAAAASSAGIDWINLVTAGEHSHLPSIDETVRALRYFQLALHVGAIARNASTKRDRAISQARAANDWSAMASHAIDPDLASQIYETRGHSVGSTCSMCGGACPLVKARRWPRESSVEGFTTWSK